MAIYLIYYIFDLLMFFCLVICYNKHVNIILIYIHILFLRRIFYGVAIKSRR